MYKNMNPSYYTFYDLDHSYENHPQVYGLCEELLFLQLGLHPLSKRLLLFLKLNMAMMYNTIRPGIKILRLYGTRKIIENENTKENNFLIFDTLEYIYIYI